MPVNFNNQKIMDNFSKPAISSPKTTTAKQVIVQMSRALCVGETITVGSKIVRHYEDSKALDSSSCQKLYDCLNLYSMFPKSERNCVNAPRESNMFWTFHFFIQQLLASCKIIVLPSTADSDIFVRILKKSFGDVIAIEERKSYEVLEPNNPVFFALPSTDIHALTEVVVDRMTKLSDGSLYLLAQESLKEEIAESLIDALKRSTGEPAADVEFSRGVKGKCVAPYIILNDYIDSAGELKMIKKILYTVTFRTVGEAAKLAKSLPHFCAASVWGGDFSLNLSLAEDINYSKIWINTIDENHLSIPDCYECYKIPQTPTGKGLNRDFVQNLIQTPVMAKYKEYALKWLNDEVSVPSGLNIIVRTMGYIPEVSIVFTSSAKEETMQMCIAALAAGCKVSVIFTVNSDSSKDEVAELSKIVPEGMLKVVDTCDRGNTMVFDPRHFPSQTIDVGFLSSSLILRKWIWLS